MKPMSLALITCLFITRVGVGAEPAAETKKNAVAAKRHFTFHYKFRVKDLPSATKGKSVVKVWLPCPATSDAQEIVRGEVVAPAKLTEHLEARFGNKILYLELPVPEKGEFTVDIPYDVVRKEVRAIESSSTMSAEKLDDMKRALYLAADKLVPISGKPLKILADVELRDDKLAMARQLYELVDRHCVYKKEGTGWGRGDTNWVCESGYGNCTDFHSLFISLARSQGLPSRFEIGFSIPTDKKEGPVVGYHCWAWFHLNDRGWIPVDISEADKFPAMKEYYFGNLTADRVMFSTGRDVKLSPPSAQQPLNFFVFPYIEVDGEPLPSAKIELQNSFHDKL